MIFRYQRCLRCRENNFRSQIWAISAKFQPRNAKNLGFQPFSPDFPDIADYESQETFLSICIVDMLQHLMSRTALTWKSSYFHNILIYFLDMYFFFFGTSIAFAIIWKSENQKIENRIIKIIENRKIRKPEVESSALAALFSSQRQLRVGL